MKYVKFESFDKSIIQCYLWDEVRQPKGVVQIVHGMAEHGRRYDDFALFLNKNGYIAFADDHRAHGNTEKAENIGYHEGDIYFDSVKDEIAITEYLQKKYNLPIVLVGHSYGSFLSQRYIQLNCQGIKGVILSGSADMQGMLINIGASIASFQNAILGGKKKGVLIDKLSFGSYNKPFKKEGLKFGWLSRDKEQVKKYILDPQCGYVMSIGFSKYFLNGLKKAYKPENLAAIDKKLPIAIFSGSQDPVGGNGKLVKKLFERYKALGIEDVSIKIYEGGRHEILNETNNKEVYADFLQAIEGFVKPEVQIAPKPKKETAVKVDAEAKPEVQIAPKPKKEAAVKVDAEAKPKKVAAAPKSKVE
ncbi:MAG TPA: alpha/beta hydrolase [Clostridia bacterium]|nr:alpha/beta hydrolase [Clostridia bacterium]